MSAWQPGQQDKYGRSCTCRNGPTHSERFGWLHFDHECALMQEPTQEQRRAAGECANWPASYWGRYASPCGRQATGDDGLCNRCRAAKARAAARRSAA